MPDSDETSKSSRQKKRPRTAEIKKLLALMESYDLEELEVAEGDFRVRLKKAGTQNPTPQAQPAPPPAAKEKVQEEPEVPSEQAVFITAKLVGIFYRAPAPDASAFVEVGDPVDEETAVCILEAMKVMNEVKSGVVGTIHRILVENGTPVEYGQRLFEVVP